MPTPKNIIENQFFIGLILFFILLFMNISLAQPELDNAISWLKANQNANGYWGLGISQEHWTASSLIALHEAQENANKAPDWLKLQIENFSSMTWTADEADIPAIIIYSFYVTGNESAIDIEKVSEKLKTYQNTNNNSNSYGGFRGFKENAQTPVESSVDTAFSLLALSSYENFTVDESDAAMNFLRKLQNGDGSFNLTFSTQSHALYSLAPDPVSLTALTVIALSEVGEDTSNAAEFLKKSARTCFGNENRSYSAAMSALAFHEIGESEYAEAAANYLKILQKSDGGFADSTRTNPSASNPLDTAFAIWALARIGENTTSAVCAPLEASIDLENSFVEPGEVQNISLNISGAVSDILVKIRYPNSSVIEFGVDYEISKTLYGIEFNDTNQTGTYNVSAEIKPIYGETFFTEPDFFDVVAINPATTTTTSTSTTTTAAPAPTTTVATGDGAAGGGATNTTNSTTSTTTTTISTITPIIPTITVAAVTGEVIATENTESDNSTNITANATSPATGEAAASPALVGIVIIAAAAVFLIYKKLPRKRTHKKEMDKKFKAIKPKKKYKNRR